MIPKTFQEMGDYSMVLNLKSADLIDQRSVFVKKRLEQIVGEAQSHGFLKLHLADLFLLVKQLQIKV